MAKEFTIEPGDEITFRRTVFSFAGKDCGLRRKEDRVETGILLDSAVRDDGAGTMLIRTGASVGARSGLSRLTTSAIVSIKPLVNEHFRCHTCGDSTANLTAFRHVCTSCREIKSHLGARPMVAALILERLQNQPAPAAVNGPKSTVTL